MNEEEYIMSKIQNNKPIYEAIVSLRSDLKDHSIQWLRINIAIEIARQMRDYEMQNMKKRRG